MSKFLGFLLIAISLLGLYDNIHDQYFSYTKTSAAQMDALNSQLG